MHFYEFWRKIFFVFTHISYWLCCHRFSSWPFTAVVYIRMLRSRRVLFFRCCCDRVATAQSQYNSRKIIVSAFCFDLNDSKIVFYFLSIGHGMQWFDMRENHHNSWNFIALISETNIDRGFNWMWCGWHLKLYWFWIRMIHLWNEWTCTAGFVYNDRDSTNSFFLHQCSKHVSFTSIHIINSSPFNLDYTTIRQKKSTSSSFRKKVK